MAHATAITHRTAVSAPVARTGERRESPETVAAGMDPSFKAAGLATTSKPEVSLSKAREKLISHALSRILRHEAPAHGLHMTQAGYVAMRDLLRVPA